MPYGIEDTDFGRSARDYLMTYFEQLSAASYHGVQMVLSSAWSTCTAEMIYGKRLSLVQHKHTDRPTALSVGRLISTP